MQIVTSSGEIIPLLSTFKPKIEDIAHALSQINRYGGHTKFPYSVAQHSVLVSYQVPTYLAFQGLMHDAHETYSTDLPKPTKDAVDYLGKDGWKTFEDSLSDIVRRYFKLPLQCHKAVKQADYTLYRNEIGSLFTDKAKSSFLKLGVVPAYDIMIEPLSVSQAYNQFLDRFFELSNGVK